MESSTPSASLHLASAIHPWYNSPVSRSASLPRPGIDSVHALATPASDSTQVAVCHSPSLPSLARSRDAGGPQHARRAAGPYRQYFSKLKLGAEVTSYPYTLLLSVERDDRSQSVLGAPLLLVWIETLWLVEKLRFDTKPVTEFNLQHLSRVSMR